jgi:hypothetical protein
MSKATLLVSSAIQAALLNEFLLAEMQDGFWRDMRPAGHGAVWAGVKVEVSTTEAVGPVGFTPLKNYDFLNPEFTKLNEAKLVAIAQAVKANMTFKALKKELIELARIIGGRMTDKTKEPARLFRGNNRADFDVIRSIERQKVVTVAGAKAAVDAAAKTVKKTVTKKKAEPVAEPVVAAKKTATKKSNKVKLDVEEGVTVTVTSSGATVRKVAAKTTAKA